MARSKVAATVGVLFALVVSILGLIALPNRTRNPGTQVDLLAPAIDPRHSPIDNHIQWALDGLNGTRAFAESEVRDRFSKTMLSAVSPSNFLQQSETLAKDRPYEFRGVLQDTTTVKVVSVRSRSGDGYISVAVATGDPQHLEGLFIGKEAIGASAPISAGYLTTIVFGGISLSVLGAYFVWQHRGRLGAMLLVAATLHLLQLFLGFNASAIFSLGLMIPAFASALIGHATLRSIVRTASASSTDTLKDRIVIGSMYTTAVVSASIWLFVDTAIVGLPRHVPTLQHNSNLAHTLANTASICALTSAALLVARHLDLLVRRRSNEQSITVQDAFFHVAASACAVTVLVGALLWVTGTKQYQLLPSFLIDIAMLTISIPFAVLAFGHVSAKKRELVETRASRARLLEAADAARRQIERDLHDGTQQRLLAVLMGIRRNQQKFGHLDDELDNELERSANDLQAALDELRDIARGLHPSALDHGLQAALEGLAERAPLPVDVRVDKKLINLPLDIATAAYFVVAEAITNTARHANASYVHVSVAHQPINTNGVATTNATIQLSVSDNGVGGADLRDGTGLRELRDRVEAIGGALLIESPLTKGTTISASIPIPNPRDQSVNAIGVESNARHRG
jgi:signal transduction histidine kinase